MESSLAPRHHRLRGRVRGSERTFDLYPGEYRVGSSAASQIPLPVQGVSRQHAVLLVTPGGLVVEDRGSTNGSFVNDRRVERASVPPDAELRFGPVRLKVETVETEDAAIAIAVPAPQPPASPAASDPVFDRTTQVRVEDRSAAVDLWMGLVAGFVERLSAAAVGDLSRALSLLVETLDVEGCCAVEWPPDGEDPLVLGAAAEFGEIPGAAEVRDLGPAPSIGEKDTAPEIRTAFFEMASAPSLAVRFAPGLAPRGLVTWGDFDGRLASTGLLRALLRALDALCPPDPCPLDPRLPVPTCHDAGSPALSFPPRYHPGNSPAMAAVYRQMRQLLRGDLPVLVIGETGVGKEQIARTLHSSSPRRRGPFVPVNCAALPADLLEAEMFGIARGVATGVEKRAGKFQLAEGGTLFLDEVGEMAPALQAKFLRVLQDKEIQPVGAAPRSVDVRVVAATNADLFRHMDEGRFRRDLFYRLSGYLLEVPPLRRCREDLAALVQHFLLRFVSESGIRVRGLSARALAKLCSYSWPGNVRELEHEVRRLVYLAHDGQVIDSSMVSRYVVAEPEDDLGVVPKVGPFPEDEGSLEMKPQVRELETSLIREALRRAGGQKALAAKLLGLSRNGLAKKINRWGLG